MRSTNFSTAARKFPDKLHIYPQLSEDRGRLRLHTERGYKKTVCFFRKAALIFQITGTRTQDSPKMNRRRSAVSAGNSVKFRQISKSV